MMNKKLIYISLFSFSWAFLIFFNKLAINAGASAFPYTIQTTIFAVLLLLVYNIIFRRAGLKKLKPRDTKRLTVIGLLVGTAYIAGFYGLKLSTAVNYGFLVKSTLLFTTLLAYFFLGERFNKRKTALLITFTLGIYLLSTGEKTITPRIGDLLILL